MLYAAKVSIVLLIIPYNDKQKYATKNNKKFIRQNPFATLVKSSSSRTLYWTITMKIPINKSIDVRIKKKDLSHIVTIK